MNFYERITGSDMTKQQKAFLVRIEKLPSDYQEAWKEVNQTLWRYSDFSGRNLTPVLESIVEFFEESAQDHLTIKESIGDDIEAFTTSVAQAQEINDVRDKWRTQLNQSVSKKLGR